MYSFSNYAYKSDNNWLYLKGSCRRLPRSYQLLQWLYLWLFRYSNGYSYEVFPPSRLPAMPMAIPISRSYKLLLYGYSYGVVSASKLPAIPMCIHIVNTVACHIAMPMLLFFTLVWQIRISIELARHRGYQLFRMLLRWIFLWSGPALDVTSYWYGYSYGYSLWLFLYDNLCDYSYGVLPPSLDVCYSCSHSYGSSLWTLAIEVTRFYDGYSYGHSCG